MKCYTDISSINIDILIWKHLEVQSCVSLFSYTFKQFACDLKTDEAFQKTQRLSLKDIYFCAVCFLSVKPQASSLCCYD